MSSVHNEWTQHENKLFEMALAEVDPNSPDQFEQIASKVPGKTVEQVQTHYQMLVDDIEMIEADQIPIPNYIEIVDDDDSDIVPPTSNKRAKKEPAHPMSTKGIPWTDEEHRMFLIGLKKCERGDWRCISRNYVKSKTPTQVASHAQKHFLRISSSNTNSTAGTSAANSTRRQRHPRPSIHDIRNSQADGHHQAAPMQVPLIRNTTNNNNVVSAAKNNNFRRPIAPTTTTPYPSTEAFSSSSFSSTSSTARTTTTTTTLRRTSNLITNSNFNNGSSRLGRSPQILNNTSNYGSSPSYSQSTFMMSSAPHAVPQQQYPRPPLHHGQHRMTAAGAGGAFYGGYPHNTNYNNNMLMNYQQAPQIQSSPSYGYNNTGLWRNERSGGGIFELDPTVAEPPAATAYRSSIGTGSGSGGGIFEFGPTVAEPPAATAYRSSTGSGGGIFELGLTVAEPPAATAYRSSTGPGSGGIFELGPTVAEPPAATTYRSSTGPGSGGIFELGPTVAEPPAATTYRSSTGSGGGGVFHLGTTVEEPAAAVQAPNISLDVNDNNTNIINHPYNYDQPIYSPAYEDMYPAYM